MNELVKLIKKIYKKFDITQKWLSIIKQLCKVRYKITRKIINLIPIIRKYYSFNNIKAVGEPGKIKRHWLSIIKQLCKVRYKITRNIIVFIKMMVL